MAFFLQPTILFTMKTWMTPWGALELARFPYDDDEALQAWNAADTLLLRQVQEKALPQGSLVFVYNDAFGALTTALVAGGYKVAQISDSSLAQRSTLWNLDHNGLAADPLFLLDSLSIPDPETMADGETMILYRLPRSVALLQFQLRQIRNFLPQGRTLYAAAMAKDIHSSTLEVFESQLGSTKTSLADTKARLIFSVMEEKILPSLPFPRRWTVKGLELQLVNHAAVFSSEGLDEGTRLLLQNFPKIGPQVRTVIDLGCGNGILGLAAAKRAPEVEVYCVDESFMAVWSARESFRLNHLGGQGIFLCGDCLEDFEKESADLILCNPPFHFQNSQTLAIAWKMFDESLRVLRPGGELWVVANRHLGHPKALMDRFPTVKTAGINEKFVVLKAVKAVSG